MHDWTDDEYIINQNWQGWAVWVSEPNWKNCNPISEYFLTRNEAEDFEAEILERARKCRGE